MYYKTSASTWNTYTNFKFSTWRMVLVLFCTLLLSGVVLVQREMSLVNPMVATIFSFEEIFARKIKIWCLLFLGSIVVGCLDSIQKKKMRPEVKEWMKAMEMDDSPSVANMVLWLKIWTFSISVPDTCNINQVYLHEAAFCGCFVFKFW